jgi:hypothetical protein
MTELVARIVVDGEERHLVLVEEVYSEVGEPWTLFVNADHYGAGRRTLDKTYYWDLDSAQADCGDRFGVHIEDWVAGDAVRLGQLFRFDYAITNQGVPQPYPLGFYGAEVFFALDKSEHPDGPSTPVLNVSGNADGLRRLAALLILCAESERYDARFHVHLEREPFAPGERAFLTGELDVTLRAPTYLADLKDGTFRELNADVDLADESDDSDEPWKSRRDA